jgi:hypothetical protein
MGPGDSLSYQVGEALVRALALKQKEVKGQRCRRKFPFYL